MHRIPHGRNQSYTPGRPVILHQHGLSDSSDSMVCNGPDLSPAYYLANAGYDVWLANQRGNKYALNHATLNTNQQQFWNFSLPETLNDSQANIEYIRNYTNSDRIAYIAHSLGNAGFFAAASRDNDWYRDRLSIFVALAPIAQTYQGADPALRLATSSRMVFIFLRKLGISFLFPSGFLANPLYQRACRIFPFLCEATELFTSEADPFVDNQNSINTYFEIFPSSTSLTNFEHYGQIFVSRRFQDFDYGPERNMIAYGTPNPPLFNITNINGIPIGLLSGSSDEVSDPRDIQWLRNQLDDNVVYTQTYEYGHLSFYTAINMTYLNDLDNLIRQYTPINNNQIG